ncbi:MAG: hypothetical protein MHPSP_000638, partial [Paramarteilia canceri]
PVLGTDRPALTTQLARPERRAAAPPPDLDSSIERRASAETCARRASWSPSERAGDTDRGFSTTTTDERPPPS